jgi:N4-gp56 family major capsid protein
MATMNTGNLPPAVNINLNKNLLSTPTAQKIYSIAASRMTMDKNSGDTMRFKRWNKLPSATAPLDDGVNPAPNDISCIYVDAKLSTYGAWIAVTDTVVLTNEDPVLNGIVYQQGVQLRDTEDDLARAMLGACANRIRCTHGLNGDVPTNITAQDILDATTMLQMADADTIMDMVEAEMRIGTGPTYDAYMCFGNSEMGAQLMAVPGYLPKYNYASQAHTLRAEHGSYAYARFFLTSKGIIRENASINGANVYDFIYAGHESYGIVDQDGMHAQFLYNPPWISGGPLQLSCECGWKTRMSTCIFNDEWLVRQSCTLSL